MMEALKVEFGVDLLPLFCLQTLHSLQNPLLLWTGAGSEKADD